MDYILEIKELSKEVYRLGLMIDGMRDGREEQFNLPAKMSEVSQFERDMCVRLPEPLVRYLTELGNGGPGPYYGIYSLERMRECNTPDSTHLPPMLDHAHSDKEWLELGKRYVLLDEMIDELWYENKDNYRTNAAPLEEEMKKIITRITAGGIFINTPGCTMNTILMCRGDAAGEVFTLDFDYMDQLHEEPCCGGKFEEWIINDMKKRISKYKNNRKPLI